MKVVQREATVHSQPERHGRALAALENECNLIKAAKDSQAMKTVTERRQAFASQMEARRKEADYVVDSIRQQAPQERQVLVETHSRDPTDPKGETQRQDAEIQKFNAQRGLYTVGLDKAKESITHSIPRQAAQESTTSATQEM